MFVKRIKIICGILIALMFSTCLIACNFDNKKLLQEQKIQAKYQILSYMEEFHCNDEDVDVIIETLSESFLSIDFANDNEEINNLTEKAKGRINDVMSNRSTIGAKQIVFSKQSQSDKVINTTYCGNMLFFSQEEVEKFFAEHDVVKDKELLFEQFDEEYFGNNAVVFCFYWAEDSQIKKQIENVYIDSTTMKVEIVNTFPSDRLVADKEIDANTDVYYNFDVLQVKKADVGNVSQIEIVHKFKK